MATGFTRQRKVCRGALHIVQAKWVLLWTLGQNYRLSFSINNVEHVHAQKNRSSPATFSSVSINLEP